MSWDLAPHIHRPQADDGTYYPAFTTRDLVDVLLPLLKGGATIKHLWLSVGNTAEIQTQTVPDKTKKARELPENDDAVWMNYLSNLRSLKLGFIFGAVDLTESPNPIEKCASFLAEATELRALTIQTDFLWDIEIDIDLAAQSFFIRELTIPKLQTLKLMGGMFIPPDDLLNFLDRHASTLRHLQFEANWLCEGGKTWPEVFDHLRNSLAGLKSMKLARLTEGRTRHRCREVILRDSNHRRRHLDIACRWILGNGEPTEAERKVSTFLSIIFLIEQY